MTKADIIEEIAHKTGIDKPNVSSVMEAFFKVVRNSMVDGNNIYVRGFGSFIIKRRAAKPARIISEKKTILIPEHFIPSFKPSKEFVKKVKESSKIKSSTKLEDKQRPAKKEDKKG